MSNLLPCLWEGPFTDVSTCSLTDPQIDTAAGGIDE
jgi:hypothetical protein